MGRKKGAGVRHEMTMNRGEGKKGKKEKEK